MIKNKKTRDSARKNQRFLIPPINLLPRNRSTPDSARLSLPLLPRNRSAQEEMVGFVVIVVIVSIALLILLGFLLRSSGKSAVESFEIENFIQSVMQYTTDCEDYTEFLSVQSLITACDEGGTCLNGKDSCEVLNETITGLIEKGWNVNEQSAVRGYKFNIMIEEDEGFLPLLSLQKGNETRNYKGAFQDFAKKGIDYEVSLNIYYD